MKRIALVFVFFVSFAFSANATPPRDLKLQYDPMSQNLMISMKHPTIEVREHYIRTIIVTHNDDEPKTYRFTFQKSASEVEAIVPIGVLQFGDKVHVKAMCKLGGSAEAELVMSPSDVQQSEEMK
ncbi:MAG: hypothetical protein H6754_00970 [Candidatus Omnitrophica bacterium]|nr:hypothetical protein [Candidatus Omnitrophota bacterium]